MKLKNFISSVNKSLLVNKEKQTMNLVNKSLIRAIIAAIGIYSLSLHGQTLACTSFVLQAEDGAAVYGRTMEWGTFDLKSRLVIVPRGHEFIGHTPDGKAGLSWKGKYGVVALDALEKDILTDGMNEKGLVVGVLYLPGFAEFQPYDPETADRSMGPSDLASYLLTEFATVDELRAGLEDVRVVPIPEPALGGITPPVHWMVADQSGKAIAVEYLEGVLKVFDNPLRVLTNAPEFHWHMTNLRNYINLSAVALPTNKIADLDFAPIGAGSGFLGIPGDYTPPSRFVRAVAYTQTARKTPDGLETVYEVLRILDNFNLPLGSAEGPQAKPEWLKGMRSSTIWTSVADTKNLVYYYHTQHNRKLRMVDLKKIDFSSKIKGFKRFPLDKIKSQEIEDVTPQ
jgi:choloylglycine hydrolase